MRRSPDIAILLHSLAGGGAERVSLLLAAEFVARGLEVDLVLCTVTGPLLNDVPSGVKVVDCDATSSLGWGMALHKYLKDGPAPDLLAMMEGAAIVALMARRLARTKTRIHAVFHNSFSLQFSEAGTFRQRTLMPWVSRRLLPKADGLIAVSKGVARDVEESMELPPGRVVAIHNPVVDASLNDLAKQPPEHPWLRARHIHSGTRVIVSAGRLTRQKGFDTLLRAFSQTRPAEREFRLIILGEGDDRPELEQLARDLNVSDRVSFPGFVDNPFAIFSAADLFVLSSRWEGFGNVLAEAMACGCPVVSTDCPSGPSEILENGKWGALAPVDDTETLSRAIVETLRSPLAADLLRARGGAFSVANSADAYLRALERDKS